MNNILEGIFEDCFELDKEFGQSKHLGHDEQLSRFKERISSKDKLPYNQAVYIFDEKSRAREKFCELIFDNNLLNEEDFSHLIFSVHVMCRGNRGLVDWCVIEKTILMMKKAKTPYILGDKAGKTFDNLKSDFEIYRGTREMEKDKAEKGICWSIHKEIASRFIDPNGNNRYLFSGKINKKDVLAYIETNDEFEIIADHHDIQSISCKELSAEEVKDLQDKSYKLFQK